jgi:PAS domain S-box-containing protein
MSGKRSDPEVPNELRSLFQVLRDETTIRRDWSVEPDYQTLVDGDRRYVEVSESFCQLTGYSREELIGKRYDDLTAPGTTDIPAVFRLFVRSGYMHGLWMLRHRDGTPILVRYEAWVRPDCFIESRMQLVNDSDRFLERLRDSERETLGSQDKNEVH